MRHNTYLPTYVNLQKTRLLHTTRMFTPLKIAKNDSQKPYLLRPDAHFLGHEAPDSV